MFDGIGVSDDASVYQNRFRQAQKCWALLLRKAIKLALLYPGNQKYQGFLDQLLGIYRDGKRSAGDGRLAFDLPPAPVTERSKVATEKHSAVKAAERDLLTERDLVALEKANLQTVLARTDGRIFGDGGAADLLGLKPTTLLSRLKRHGIKR